MEQLPLVGYIPAPSGAATPDRTHTFVMPLSTSAKRTILTRRTLPTPLAQAPKRRIGLRLRLVRCSRTTPAGNRARSTPDSFDAPSLRSVGQSYPCSLGTWLIDFMQVRATGRTQVRQRKQQAATNAMNPTPDLEASASLPVSST